MKEGYLRLATDETEETPEFDLKKFLTDLKFEGLLRMDFVLEFYPEPFDDPPGSDPSKGDVLKSTREQIQTGSWYILLDFAR